MRWDDFRRSDNVDDFRGEEGGGGGGGGFGGGFGGPGGFQLPIGGGGLGIGTVLVLGIIGFALGIDPSVLIGGAEVLTGNRAGYQQPYQERRSTRGAPTDRTGQFVAAILGNTEDTWQTIFSANGKQYRAPRLVLFNNAIQGGCGMAQSAMGPFYCPNDQRIYIDTAFFQEIERRFRGCTGKACEFSQAYVLAHEVGHHVQNQFGTLTRARRAQEAAGGGRSPQANAIQVRVELQADCYAGVWAKNSNEKWKFIESGDVEAAMQTAAAIGDDTLQKRAQGRVVPDSFTHGSAAQRQRWFNTGFQSGKIDACDTFKASSL